MRLSLIIGICILSVFFAHCKKDDNNIIKTGLYPRPTISVPISNEIKEWGYFKPGSYWIVRDSSTQTLDSVYVISVTTQLSTYPYNNDTSVVAEEIKVSFSSNIFYSSYTLSSYPFDRIKEPYSMHFVVFQTDTTHLEKVPGAGIMNYENIPSTVIGGINYSDIFYFFYSYKYTNHNGGPFWHEEKSYWKKNVGILKRIYQPYYSSRESAEVVRYNVIQ